MGVPFSAGECFCGELDPWKLSKTWAKAFSFYFFFFFLIEQVVLGTGALAKLSLVLWALY